MSPNSRAPAPCACHVDPAGDVSAPPSAPMEVELFTEGDVLYAAMLASIKGGCRVVRMESYIFAGDGIGWEFAVALAERAQAGVDVRLHLDAAGAFGESTPPLVQYGLQRGVQVQWFHRWNWLQPLRYNRRNHRKLLVVDDRLAYVGGFNIHRESSRRFYGEMRWRDTHASISGVLVLDGKWAALGTANLDYRSFFVNCELVLAVDQPSVCTQLEQVFLDDLSQSRPVTAGGWARRRWPQRLLECVGWIARRWL